MKSISLLAILLASISLSAQEVRYDKSPSVDSIIKIEVVNDNKQKPSEHKTSVKRYKEKSHIDKNKYSKDPNRAYYVDKRKELKKSQEHEKQQDYKKLQDYKKSHDYKKSDDYKKVHHDEYKSYNKYEKYDEYEKGKIRTH